LSHRCVRYANAAKKKKDVAAVMVKTPDAAARAIRGRVAEGYPWRFPSTAERWSA
jgi:hypothetical protein